MKVLILADPDSSHTFKWASSLAEKGIDIYLFSLTSYNHDSYNRFSIKIEHAGIDNNIRKKVSGLSKLVYLRSYFEIVAFIKEIKPDIIHSHYASSYGLLGALTKFHPFIISTWGSDIVSFPQKSFIHRYILRYNLKMADKILATSSYLAKETEKLTTRKVDITPFGIDINQFHPAESPASEDCIVIGTIKSLEKTYGIEYLMRAFKKVKDKLPSSKLKLLIVGGGSMLNEYRKLTEELKIENDTTFTGYIKPGEVAKYHNMLDIYVALSNEESFGVAVLEASACQKPVVVTNVGGLTEVVEDNETGFVVEPRNIDQAADAIEKLVVDKNLRQKFGSNGRQRVLEKFNWEKNVEQMISIYKNIIKQ